MAVPTIAERLTALLTARYVDGDTVNNAILDAIIGAIADVAGPLGEAAFGTDAIPAGQALTNPEFAPEWALAHAGLWTGGMMPGRPAGESTVAYLARARDALVYPLGIKRGTEEAVRRVAEPLLTGTKSLFISYSGGDPYLVAVRTITSETPNAAAVQAAIEGSYYSGGQRGALRAELHLSYVVSDDPTFAEATRTFAAVAAGVTSLNVTRANVT